MDIFRKVVLLLCLITIQSARAYGNYFDSLTTDAQILLLDSVINTFIIKECCDTALGPCLSVKPKCTIANRFYNFTSWLIMKNEPFEKCITQLNKRYQSFFDPDTFSFSPTILPPAGDTASPITITAYVNASCNLCKKVCIPLHMAVTEGPIIGKAKLQLKPATMQIGDRAFMAAAKMGKFWEFFLSLEKIKRRLDENILIIKARKVGLDKTLFEKYLYDEKIKAELQKMRKEALSNGVEISPTLFINNRRYQSYKDPQWVIDAVEYEYKRIKQ